MTNAIISDQNMEVSTTFFGELETGHTLTKKKHWCWYAYTPGMWSLPNLKVNGACRIGLMLSLHWHPQEKHVQQSEKAGDCLGYQYLPSRNPKHLLWLLVHFEPFTLACFRHSPWLAFLALFVGRCSSSPSPHQRAPDTSCPCRCRNPFVPARSQHPIHSTCVHWLLSSPKSIWNLNLHRCLPWLVCVQYVFPPHCTCLTTSKDVYSWLVRK